MIWLAILAFTAFIASPERHLVPPAGDDNEINIHQQALENANLFGGDMLIPSEQWTSLGNGIADEAYRWPGYPGGAIIPYVIDESLSRQTDLIEKAMKHYHDNTCVKFVKRTTEEQYVNIFLGDGCYSMVGRTKDRKKSQPLSLGVGCHKIGTIIHELGHVVGFYHEQNRSDRDEHLKIFLDNVWPRAKSNFIKLSPSENILINDFDYDSIMIYGNYAFSITPNELKTMEAKNGQTLLNPYSKAKMTDSDIERVNKMYKCPGKSS